MTKEGGIAPVSTAQTTSPTLRGGTTERSRFSTNFKPSVGKSLPRHEFSDHIGSVSAIKETQPVWSTPKREKRPQTFLPEMVFPVERSSAFDNGEAVATDAVKRGSVFGPEWNVLAGSKKEVTIFAIPSTHKKDADLPVRPRKERTFPIHKQFRVKSEVKEPTAVPDLLPPVIKVPQPWSSTGEWQSYPNLVRTDYEEVRPISDVEVSNREQAVSQTSDFEQVEKHTDLPHRERIAQVRADLAVVHVLEPEQSHKPTREQKERQERLVTVEGLQNNMPDIATETIAQNPKTPLEKQQLLMRKRQEFELQKILALDGEQSEGYDQEHRKRMSLARGEKDEKEYIRDEDTNRRRVDQLVAIYDTLSPEERRSPQEIALRMPKEQPEPLKSKILRSIRGTSTDYSYYWFIDLFKKSKPLRSREDVRQSAELATATYSAADYGKGKALSWDYVKTFVLAISTAGIQTMRK